MIDLFYAFLNDERRSLLIQMLNNPASMSIQDLTASTNLHQTTIRTHVEVLFKANLLMITVIGNTPKYDVIHKAEIKTLLAAAKVICA